MRLLNVESLRLETFPGHMVPPYAILSHTWDGAEILLGEVSDPRSSLPLLDPHRPAVAKIRTACLRARSDGFLYIWIDTCCIDKTSSAELSESINSMFRWYQHADVCYAYLSDYHHKNNNNNDNDDSNNNYCPDPTDVEDVDEDAFCASRWWTRGWTLQELLAPRHVVFFDRSWTRLGTRRDAHLCQLISRHTGISTQILDGGRCSCPAPGDPDDHGPRASRSVDNIRSGSRDTHNSGLGLQCGGCLRTDGFLRTLDSLHASVKLSWASARVTTRPEDAAYALLGLFGVSMPLLYGEGGRAAFMRLQTEIIRKSNDHSILLWSSDDDLNQSTGAAPGCLALSPEPFRSPMPIVHQRVYYPEGASAEAERVRGDVDTLVCHAQLQPVMSGESMRIVDQVVKISLWVCPAGLDQFPEDVDWYLGLLDCTMAGSYLARPAILLEHLGRDVYRRYLHSSHGILVVDPSQVTNRQPIELEPFFPQPRKRRTFNSKMELKINQATRKEISILANPSVQSINASSEIGPGLPITNDPIILAVNSLDCYATTTVRVIHSDPELYTQGPHVLHLPPTLEFTPDLNSRHPVFIGGIHVFQIDTPNEAAEIKVYLIWGLHAAAEPRNPQGSGRHPWQTWCRVVRYGGQPKEASRHYGSRSSPFAIPVPVIDANYLADLSHSLRFKLRTRNILRINPSAEGKTWLHSPMALSDGRPLLPSAFQSAPLADRIVDLLPQSRTKIGLSARVVRSEAFARASYQMEMTILSPQCQGWWTASCTGGPEDQTPDLQHSSLNDPTAHSR